MRDEKLDAERRNSRLNGIASTNSGTDAMMLTYLWDVPVQLSYEAPSNLELRRKRKRTRMEG